MSCSKDPGERALIEKALGGDAASSRGLAETIRPAIESGVRRAFGRGDVDRRRDFAQDAWVYLLEDGARRLLAYDEAKGSLFKFVWVVAVRTTINSLKRDCAAKRGGQMSIISGTDEMGDLSSADKPEHRPMFNQLCRAAGNEFSELDAKIFAKIYLEGLLQKQIAEELDVSIGVVRSALRRIRSIIRRLARSHGP